METLRAIAQRTSIRQFSNKPVSEKDLLRIIDAARRAPTARGLKPWEFVIVQDRQILARIAELCENGRFIQEANCCLVVFCRDTKYYLEDGCAATENILLAATDLGLASCWVAGDKKPYCQKIKQVLKAPLELKLVSMVALGYAKEKFQAHKKRSIDEVVHREHF